MEYTWGFFISKFAFTVVINRMVPISFATVRSNNSMYKLLPLSLSLSLHNGYSTYSLTVTIKITNKELDILKVTLVMQRTDMMNKTF